MHVRIAVDDFQRLDLFFAFCRLYGAFESSPFFDLDPRGAIDGGDLFPADMFEVCLHHFLLLGAVDLRSPTANRERQHHE